MLRAEEALGGGGRYLAAAQHAAAAVWDRGLLTKASGRSGFCAVNELGRSAAV